MGQNGNLPGQTFDQIQSTLGTKKEPVPMDSSQKVIVWGTPETDGEAGWTSLFAVEENKSYLITMGLTGSQANDYVANDPATQHWWMSPMIFFATGASQTSFDWNAYAVFEVKGRTITGVTGSRADPDAYSAVAGFMTSTPYKHVERHTAKDVGKWALEQTGFMTSDGNVHWGKVAETATSLAGRLF
jgi:hypothetical protein